MSAVLRPKCTPLKHNFIFFAYFFKVPLRGTPQGRKAYILRPGPQLIFINLRYYLGGYIIMWILEDLDRIFRDGDLYATETSTLFNDNSADVHSGTI